MTIKSMRIAQSEDLKNFANKKLYNANVQFNNSTRHTRRLIEEGNEYISGGEQ